MAAVVLGLAVLPPGRAWATDTGNCYVGDPPVVVASGVTEQECSDTTAGAGTYEGVEHTTTTTEPTTTTTAPPTTTTTAPPATETEDDYEYRVTLAAVGGFGAGAGIAMTLLWALRRVRWS